MPLVVSYFVIPLVFLLLLVNVYFRVILVRQFKFLKEQNIQIDPKVLMKKEQREAYFAKHYPQHNDRLTAFSLALTKLIRYVVIGFLLILISFLYIYFSR